MSALRTLIIICSMLFVLAWHCDSSLPMLSDAAWSCFSRPSLMPLSMKYAMRVMTVTMMPCIPKFSHIQGKLSIIVSMSVSLFLEFFENGLQCGGGHAEFGL